VEGEVDRGIQTHAHTLPVVLRWPDTPTQWNCKKKTHKSRIPHKRLAIAIDRVPKRKRVQIDRIANSKRSTNTRIPRMEEINYLEE
jgi:hypothetical protein